MLVKDKVENLIKLGYDDDVIAMALGLSDKQVEYTKRQLEQERARAATSRKTVSKLQLLRERYFKLYNANYGEPKVVQKSITEEQRKEIVRRLDEAEKLLSSFIKDSESTQKKKLSEIKDLYSYMDDLVLPTDLVRRAYSIFPEKFLYKIRDRYINAAMQRIIKSYKSKTLESINLEIASTNDLDGLIELSKKLREVSDMSYLAVSSLRSKINNKIYDIKINAYKEQVDVPDDKIEELISSLMNPDVDIEIVKETMKRYSLEYYERKKKMVEETAINSNLARLQAPTIEGSIKQVEHQLLTTIKNPKIEIGNIDFLCQRLMAMGLSKGVVVHRIVDRLIQNKQFDEATSFVEKNFADYKDRNELTSKKGYEHQIQNARICHYIMKGINAPEGTIADEDRYYDMIIAGIEKAKVDPHVLNLGRSKDGKKSICFADLMEKQKAKVDMDFTD